jgi:hypothetical protein
MPACEWEAVRHLRCRRFPVEWAELCTIALYSRVCESLTNDVPSMLRPRVEVTLGALARARNSILNCTAASYPCTSK